MRFSGQMNRRENENGRFPFGDITTRLFYREKGVSATRVLEVSAQKCGPSDVPDVLLATFSTLPIVRASLLLSQPSKTNEPSAAGVTHDVTERGPSIVRRVAVRIGRAACAKRRRDVGGHVTQKRSETAGGTTKKKPDVLTTARAVRREGNRVRPR